MPYMVTFTINIPRMLAYIYIPYMDPMGNTNWPIFFRGVGIPPTSGEFNPLFWVGFTRNPTMDDTGPGSSADFAQNVAWLIDDEHMIDNFGWVKIYQYQPNTSYEDLSFFWLNSSSPSSDNWTRLSPCLLFNYIILPLTPPICSPDFPETKLDHIFDHKPSIFWCRPAHLTTTIITIITILWVYIYI